MADQDLDAIMLKLANLKELADKPGTAGEAAAAAAAIQRLLFKYNLTMSDLKDKDDLQNPFVNNTMSFRSSIRDPDNAWKAMLLGVVARNNFCRVILLMNGKSAAIVGRTANVAVVEGMYDYLYYEALRLRKDQYTIHRNLHGTKYGDASLWARSFYVGFCETMNSRFVEQNKQDEKESGSKGSALVIQSQRELLNALAKFYPHAAKVGIASISTSERGRQAGNNAGNKVNLGKQVSGGDSPPSLPKG